MTFRNRYVDNLRRQVRFGGDTPYHEHQAEDIVGGTFGSINILSSLKSNNWNGAIPADLSTVADASATAGMYLDFQSGSMQLIGTQWVGSGNNIAVLSGSDATYRLWAGHATAASAPFSVTKAGVLYASGATISGTITATAGSIGGWTVDATSIKDAAGLVGLSSAVTAGDDIRFWAGHATPGSAPFRVTEAGVITATSGQIGGWTLGATALTAGTGATTTGLDSGGTNPAFYAGSATPASAPFRVTQAGALTATSAWVTGTITATAGSIGSFTIGTYLYTGSKVAYDDGLAGVHVGSDGIGLGATFKVSAAGAVTATSGAIAGFTLSGTSLYTSTKTAYDDTVVGVHVGTDGIGLYSDASNYFRVSAAGVLSAKNVTLSGSITATTGNIGGFTVSASALYTGSKTAYNDANAGVHFGTDGIGIGNNQFTVSSAGAVTAASVSVTGDMVLSGSGAFKTGTGAVARIEMSAAGQDSIIFYASDGATPVGRIIGPGGDLNSLGFWTYDGAAYRRRIVVQTGAGDGDLRFLNQSGTQIGIWDDTDDAWHWSGDTYLIGSLYPETEVGVYDIGAFDKAWDAIYATRIFDQAGTQRFDLDGDWSSAGTITATRFIANTDGTVSLPAFSFEGGTGFYESAADEISTAIDGSEAMRVWDAGTNKHFLWLRSTSPGDASITQQSHGGFLATRVGMNATTNKYGGAYWFGSTDVEFTTNNPKILAGLVGVATEAYGADTDAGMDILFLNAAINGGATPTLTETLLVGDAAFTYKGNTVWHAANDGTGSGMDADTVDGVEHSAITGYCPVGAILMWGGAAAPTGYVLCDGTSYLRAGTYAALFAVIGTTYGSVDGTHFNVPDLRQRFPLGKAAAGTGSALAGTGGAIDHAHTSDPHSHTGSSLTITAHGTETTETAATAPKNVANDATAHTIGGSTGSTTPDDTGTNNPPYLVVNFIIRYA